MQIHCIVVETLQRCQSRTIQRWSTRAGNTLREKMNAQYDYSDRDHYSCRQSHQIPWNSLKPVYSVVPNEAHRIPSAHRILIANLLQHNILPMRFGINKNTECFISRCSCCSDLQLSSAHSRRANSHIHRVWISHSLLIPCDVKYHASIDQRASLVWRHIAKADSNMFSPCFTPRGVNL